MAAVQVLLRDPAVRLLTLTGPGGVGKTRLAGEVARSLTAEFPDGVYFVPLAGISEPDMVAPALALALGIRAVGDRSARASLLEELPHRHALLVLDNFEHVDDAAPLLGELLAAGTELKLLVTSRSLLHLAAEYHLPIPPLAYPDPAQLPPATELAGIASVRLFAERARAATGTFAISAENAAIVADICRRLDGLPLAIELAAAWTRLLSPAALLDRLATRLMELTGGPRDAPARHQTIRDTLAWSHDLLTQDERELFAKLGVFAGGWSIEAADAVAGTPAGNVVAGISRLVDQSLVYRASGSSAESRFEMLETIREYAREQLLLSGKKEITEQRHSSYFLSLAEFAHQALDGPDEVVWLARIGSDYDNLRAVLGRAIDNADPDTALRLGVSLWGFWAQRGHLSEGRSALERALTTTAAVDLSVRVRAVYCLGILALDLGDLPEARARLTESLSIWRELGNQDGIAVALNGLGLVARDLGEHRQATEQFEEALAIWTALGDDSSVATAQINLGFVATAEGRYERAQSFYEDALEIRRRLGNAVGIAYTLWALATVARIGGDVTTANIYLRQSLDTFRSLGDRLGEAQALHGLAKVAQQSGDDTESLRLLRDALTQFMSLGMRGWMVTCIECIAAVAGTRGHLEQAVRLLSATGSLRGNVVPALTIAERQERAETLSLGRRSLSTTEFAAAQAAGQALSLEEAAEEALALTEETAVLTRPPLPFNLTRREQEVLALLAEHLTDAEIAERLYLSPRTASNHVANILGKLGVSSRREAAAFATRHGLV